MLPITVYFALLIVTAAIGLDHLLYGMLGMSKSATQVVPDVAVLTIPSGIQPGAVLIAMPRESAAVVLVEATRTIPEVALPTSLTLTARPRWSTQQKLPAGTAARKIPATLLRKLRAVLDR